MSRPSPAPTPRLLVPNLLAQLAFGLMAMTLCIPSMQEWGALFGAPQADVQLSFSAYVLAYGGMQLVWGPLSDRLGRKPVLLAGLAVAALGSALAALAQGLPLLTAARALQGAGTAAGMVVGRALVQDLFQGPARTRVMAYVGMAMGLVPPLATIVGGQLHVRLGWQANFVLATGLAVGLWLAAWQGLPGRARPAAPARVGTAAAAPPETTAASAAASQPHWLRAMAAGYGRLLREPVFLLYASIISMTTATFYAFLAGAPLVLRGYGIGPDGVGYVIMAVPLAYIAGNWLTSRLVQRHGERRIMATGQAMTVAGVALMLALALAGWHSAAAFALPLVLLGLGHGLLVPVALAGTVGLMPALAGSAAAVAGVMQQLLGAAGGYAVGLLPQADAAHLGGLMLGLTCTGALALLALRGATKAR